MTHTRKMRKTRRGGATPKFTFAPAGTPTTPKFTFAPAGTPPTPFTLAAGPTTFLSSSKPKPKARTKSRSPTISSSGKRLMPRSKSPSRKRYPNK